jgi:oligoendopeptidase F
MTTEGIELDWDLGDLYAGLDDPRITADLPELKQRASGFRARYKGRIAEIAESGEALAGMLREMELIEALAGKLYAFPHLMFAADTQDPAASAASERTAEAVTEAQNDLLFVALELQDLPEASLTALSNDPALANYHHFLDRIAEERPHKLTEEIERVLNEQVLTGRDAFVKLHEVQEGGLRYRPVPRPEGGPARTEAELSALTHSPDAGTRLAAYRSIRGPLRRNNRLFGFILNTIAQDHRLDARRRNYPSTLVHQLQASDEVPEAAFRALMDATARRRGIFQDYYRLKAERLGLPMRICDLYAPWGTEQPRVELGEGRGVLVQALERFSPDYARLAEGFFSRSWVDARVRPGKQGGAFCWPVFGVHPYLLLSYTDDYESLFTLAHELGHGLHYELIAQSQTFINSDPPMVLAEIASTFNELLLLDHLLERPEGTDAATRRFLLARNLEDQLNLLFRQSTISRLELDVHEQAAKGSVDTEFVNRAWMQCYRELCGDAVEVLPEHRYDWARIGHIFFKPFYCYNYSLSAVASLACYARYRRDGAAFVPAYLDLLRSGSSRTPVEALRAVGIDLTDPATIDGALDHVASLLEELRSVVS